MKDARLRIQWAKKHIDELQGTMQRFHETNPYVWSREPDPDGLHEIITVSLKQALPCEVSLLIGDVIHNIRASLDYAVYSCGISCGANKLSRLAFPFAKDAQEYEAAATRHIKELGIAKQTFIHSQKPYRGGNDALWSIHDLDITHKHREVIPIGMTASTGAYIESLTHGSLAFSAPRWDSLIHGVKFGRVAIGTKLNGKFEISFSVAFGETQIMAGAPVVQVFAHYIRIVTDIINGLEMA